MLNSIRRSATTRNTPTPQATARINVRFGTAGTCCASTCRSGSDIVIIKPSKKDSATTTHSFLDCVIAVPTRSPIGDIASSAPSVKNTIPAISNIPPIRKHSKILGEIGAIVKDSSSTSPMMGSTACSASFSFSFSFFRIPKQSPDLSFISGNGMLECSQSAHSILFRSAHLHQFVAHSCFDLCQLCFRFAAFVSAIFLNLQHFIQRGDQSFVRLL